MVSSCSNNKSNGNYSDLITISLSYNGVATINDFEKHNEAYSNSSGIKLDRDDYYLIKLTCTVNNQSNKKLSGLDFVSYCDKSILYESGAIDRAPTNYIESNSSESFDAYIYVDKSLDSKEKIINTLKNTEFHLTSFIYDDTPLDEYSTKINLRGKFQS